MNGIGIKNVSQLQKKLISVMLDLNLKRVRRHMDTAVSAKPALQRKEQQLLSRGRQIAKKHTGKLSIHLPLTPGPMVWTILCFHTSGGLNWQNAGFLSNCQ